MNGTLIEIIKGEPSEETEGPISMYEAGHAIFGKNHPHGSKKMVRVFAVTTSKVYRAIGGGHDWRECFVIDGQIRAGHTHIGKANVDARWVFVPTPND